MVWPRPIYESELRRIAAALRDGVPVAEIAASERRGEPFVTMIRDALGIERPDARRRFTVDEIASIIAALRRGEAVGEVAARARTRHDAVRRIRRLIDLPAAAGGRPRQREKLAVLERLIGGAAVGTAVAGTAVPAGEAHRWLRAILARARVAEPGA